MTNWTPTTATTSKRATYTIPARVCDLLLCDAPLTRIVMLQFGYGGDTRITLDTVCAAGHTRHIAATKGGIVADTKGGAE